MVTQISPLTAEIPATDGGATPQPLPPGPSATRYQHIAAQFLQAFRAAAAMIPDLESPHSSTAGFVRAHTTAPMRFLSTVTLAVELNQELVALGRLDAASARDKLEYIAAFRPLLITITAFLRSFAFTINAHRAAVTAESLQVYGLAKALARSPRAAHLGPWVARMKEALGKSGRPRKVPAATSTTTPKAG